MGVFTMAEKRSAASTRISVQVGTVAVMSTLLLCAIKAMPLAAVPCSTASVECSEWLSAQPPPARLMVYTSYPLTVRNDKIERALIIVHGGQRDSNNYFGTAVAAAALSGALDDTVMIAPRFASQQGTCRDSLARDEINWDCGEGSAGGWRGGATALSNSNITSFGVLDSLLISLGSRQMFPNLRTIVVSGFSAGGQYVSRYALANRVHDAISVPISYVVGSPSSFAYPDATRPGLGDNEFKTFDAITCATFNDWPYGLTALTGYSASLTPQQLKTQLEVRPVRYFVGELESPASPALDVTCAAGAQGASRLARAKAFTLLMSSTYRAVHTLDVVPQCGHSARCVLTADVALAALFPLRNPAP
jgi:hypothetical protein